jgi:hypothetical protein
MTTPKSRICLPNVFLIGMSVFEADKFSSLQIELRRNMIVSYMHEYKLSTHASIDQLNLERSGFPISED